MSGATCMRIPSQLLLSLLQLRVQMSVAVTVAVRRAALAKYTLLLEYLHSV